MREETILNTLHSGVAAGGTEGAGSDVGIGEAANLIMRPDFSCTVSMKREARQFYHVSDFGVIE